LSSAQRTAQFTQGIPQQATALFISTTVANIRRHRTDTHTHKNWQTWWETCAVPENIQFSFSYSFLHS